MRKNNKTNKQSKITRGIAAISLAAIATMGLTGCKADEPMVLYGMPDDTMIQEELDKAAASEATSESASEATSESAATLESATSTSESETETSESEAVDINEDKSNDESVISEEEVDAAIEVAPEK